MSDKDKEQEFLWKVINHFGISGQKVKAIEELGELIVALSKSLNGKASYEDVVTEIADVYIMVEQLKLIYGPEKVQWFINYKLDRVAERIRK